MGFPVRFCERLAKSLEFRLVDGLVGVRAGVHEWLKIVNVAAWIKDEHNT